MLRNIPEWTSAVLRRVADVLIGRPSLAFVENAQRLAALGPEELMAFENTIGQMSYYGEKNNIRPAQVNSIAAEESSRVSVLGLLSFHRNGYVRHEAVRLLAREFRGEELRYLIIRQNDWVEPISIEARIAVRQRIKSGYLGEFVRVLPLVVRILAYKRYKHGAIVRMVVAMLCDPEQAALLAEAIRSPYRESRRQVVRLALELAGEHRRRVIAHGLESDDGVLRLWCCRAASSAFAGPELRRLLKSVENDSFMPARREALRLDAQLFAESGRSVWQVALLDASAAIRDLARYEMHKLGSFDAAAFYRDAIASDPHNVAAVRGLGETGDSSDLPTLRGSLASPLVSGRRAAIAALASLGRESAVPDLLRSLQDGSPAVVREARKAVHPWLHLVPAEDLFNLAAMPGPWHVRKNACQLIFELGKWKSLPGLIRLAADEDHRVAQLARELGEAWFSYPRATRVFTTLLDSDREAIEAAITANQSRIPAAFVAVVQDWLARA
jgi:hypothetical protein